MCVCVCVCVYTHCDYYRMCSIYSDYLVLMHICDCFLIHEYGCSAMLHLDYVIVVKNVKTRIWKMSSNLLNFWHKCVYTCIYTYILYVYNLISSPDCPCIYYIIVGKWLHVQNLTQFVVGFSALMT